VEGKILFREAWDKGYMEAYFPLAEQFQTQEEPTFCGLSTVTMVLNTLNVDPGRSWKGPWRWYHESVLDCCESVDDVLRRYGTTFSQIACLIRCNGAHADLAFASNSSVEDFREKVKEVCGNTGANRQYIIASYDRRVLKQTGTGHFSPVGGYHPEKDMVLILDVARFKYPPHWVRLPLLFDAMLMQDESTQCSRGYLVVQKEDIEGRFFTITNTDQHRWCEIASWFQNALGGIHGHSPKKHPVGHHSGNPPHRTLAFKPVASNCQIASPEGFVRTLITQMPQEVHEMITSYATRIDGGKHADSEKDSLSFLVASIEGTPMFKFISKEMSHSSLDQGRKFVQTFKNSMRIKNPSSVSTLTKHFLTVWMLACGMALIRRLPPDFDLRLLSQLFKLSDLPSLLQNEVLHVSRQIDALLDESLCNQCPTTILLDNER